MFFGKLYQKVITTSAPASVIIIRLLVGAVFLSEGIQKFLFPSAVGAGRFAKIGIPWAEAMAPFIGVVETICGSLIIAGLFTRLATIPLIINMLMAIVSTKIPILLGYGFWGFSLRSVPYDGFWGFAHEARTDWAMLLGSIFFTHRRGGALVYGRSPWTEQDKRLAVLMTLVVVKTSCEKSGHHEIRRGWRRRSRKFAADFTESRNPDSVTAGV